MPWDIRRLSTDSVPGVSRRGSLTRRSSSLINFCTRTFTRYLETKESRIKRSKSMKRYGPEGGLYSWKILSRRRGRRRVKLIESALYNRAIATGAATISRVIIICYHLINRANEHLFIYRPTVRTVCASISRSSVGGAPRR